LRVNRYPIVKCEWCGNSIRKVNPNGGWAHIMVDVSEPSHMIKHGNGSKKARLGIRTNGQAIWGTWVPRRKSNSLKCYQPHFSYCHKGKKEREGRASNSLCETSSLHLQKPSS